MIFLRLPSKQQSWSNTRSPPTQPENANSKDSFIPSFVYVISTAQYIPVGWYCQGNGRGCNFAPGKGKIPGQGAEASTVAAIQKRSKRSRSCLRALI